MRKRESERAEKERENEHSQYGFAHGMSWRRVDDSADFSPSALFSLPFSRPSFLALAIKQSHTHSARPHQARRPSNACTSMRPCPPTCFRTLKAAPPVAVAGRHLEMTKARGDEIPGQPPRAASPAPSSSAGGYACSTSRTASGSSRTSLSALRASGTRGSAPGRPRCARPTSPWSGRRLYFLDGPNGAAAWWSWPARNAHC